MNDSLGNTLYKRIKSARFALMNQSELANLAYIAYDLAVAVFENEKREHIDLTYPIGWNVDNTPMNSRPKRYTKNEFIQSYQVLAFHELALNGVFRLVTIIETMLGDLVRAVVLKYPGKLGKKKTIEMGLVLAATSIEEVHLRATEAFLNELSYKSPHEFARETQTLLSCNLLECPAYHRYIEVKATRDIHIHNGGIANQTYRDKAGSHARLSMDATLPVNLQYFLQSYESCLQLTEWLDKEMHSIWHSSDYESDHRELQLPLPLADSIEPLGLLRPESQPVAAASVGIQGEDGTPPPSAPTVAKE
jgi:hypothetical protein